MGLPQSFSISESRLLTIRLVFLCSVTVLLFLKSNLISLFDSPHRRGKLLYWQVGLAVRREDAEDDDMMTTNSVMMVWDCQPNDCRNRIAGLKLDHTDENDTLRHKDSSRSIILNRSKSLEKHTDRIEHRADSALYSAAKYSVHCQCLRTYVHFLVGWLPQSDAPMAFCGSASRYQEQCDRSISPVYLSLER